jgi:riboflavin biosynthesis pyrimidine reductase
VDDGSQSPSLKAPRAHPSRTAASLRQLLPAGPAVTATDLVAELGMWTRPSGAREAVRPRILLNMVSSADGHATLEGRSAPLSGKADRELFHALRAPVDAVLVGAGTMRAERYGRLIRDEPARFARRERGLAEEPLACIPSESLSLDLDIPLLADPGARVVLMTPSSGELAPVPAEVRYIRSARAGHLDLAEALQQLHRGFGVGLLLCEGGPHLAAQLFAAGLVDELFLSISPALAGEPPEGDGLRILAGVELDPAVELELLGALESDSQLFLRYGVPAPARVV